MKPFKLKNYTTSIGASQTIFEIEKLLSVIGAEAIMKELHSDGRVKSLAFQIRVGESLRGFKMPAKIERVITVCKTNRKEWGLPPDDLKLRTQAERIGWRIIKDWLHAQVSLIQIGLAEPEQIFLPYMWDGQTTLYEQLKARNFNLRLEANH